MQLKYIIVLLTVVTLTIAENDIPKDDKVSEEESTTLSSSTSTSTTTTTVVPAVAKSKDTKLKDLFTKITTKFSKLPNETNTTESLEAPSPFAIFSDMKYDEMLDILLLVMGGSLTSFVILLSLTFTAFNFLHSVRNFLTSKLMTDVRRKLGGLDGEELRRLGERRIFT